MTTVKFRIFIVLFIVILLSWSLFCVSNSNSAVSELPNTGERICPNGTKGNCYTPQ